MATELTIDLETIPDQTPGAKEEFIARAIAEFKAPSNLSKAEAVRDLLNIGKITEEEAKEHSKESAVLLWEQTFAEENGTISGELEWRKTSFDGAKGQIAVIGWKIGNGEAQAIYRNSPEPADEVRMLTEFYATLAEQLKESTTSKRKAVIDVKFIGHSIEGFDLPFLFKRSVICGVKPCIELKLSRYSENLFDTMAQWAGFGNRISLVNLCKALGFECSKGEIDGSKVWDYVLAGRIAEVAEYCKGDVEDTHKCYRRMTFQPVEA